MPFSNPAVKTIAQKWMYLIWCGPNLAHPPSPLIQHQLRLRDDCGEFAVFAVDARFHHYRRAADMQRGGDAADFFSALDGGEEIGLALDRARRLAFGQVNERGLRAEGIAEAHEDAAMQHVADAAQVVAGDDMALEAILAAIGDLEPQQIAIGLLRLGHVSAPPFMF